MAEYIGIDVRLFHYGGTPDEARDEIESLIRAALSARLPYGNDDIEVELGESAG